MTLQPLVCTHVYQVRFFIGVLYWIIGVGLIITYSWIAILRFLMMVYGLVLPPSIDTNGKKIKRENDNRRRSYCCCFCLYWPILMVFRSIEKVYEICMLFPYYIIPSTIGAVTIDIYMYVLNCMLSPIEANDTFPFDWNTFMHYISLSMMIIILMQLFIMTFLHFVWWKNQTVIVRLFHAFTVLPALIVPWLLVHVYTQHEMEKESFGI